MDLDSKILGSVTVSLVVGLHFSAIILKPFGLGLDISKQSGYMLALNCTRRICHIFAVFQYIA
jgi:hypothetical protein